jgi:hypothetical protein
MKINLKFKQIHLPVLYDNLKPYQRIQIRKEYIKRQKGLCYYCKHTLSEQAPLSVRRKKLQRGAFPRGFWKYPIHLHHSHDTGLTLGAVHNYCNAVLWQYHNE